MELDSRAAQYRIYGLYGQWLVADFPAWEFLEYMVLMFEPNPYTEFRIPGEFLDNLSEIAPHDGRGTQDFFEFQVV